MPLEEYCEVERYVASQSQLELDPIYEDLTFPKPNVFRRLPSTAFAGMKLRSRLRRVAWPPTGWRILYGPSMAARIFSATNVGAGADLICACTVWMVASACDKSCKFWLRGHATTEADIY